MEPRPVRADGVPPPGRARSHPRRPDAERRVARLRQRRRDDRGDPVPAAVGELVPGWRIVSGGARSATRMAEAIRAGEVSSKELVAEALERAETWQPVTNAFSQVFADEASGEAALVDDLLARDPNSHEGPLLGVPVAIKELFDLRGTEN